MIHIDDARALNRLLFNSPRLLPGGVVCTDSEEPIMWLLYDQKRHYFVNNSDYVLSAVTVFFAIQDEEAPSGGISETIVGAKTGRIGACEVHRLSLERQADQMAHWPSMEVHISVQCTQRSIHLLTNAADALFPTFPLILKNFNLPENVRYVYAFSRARA